MTYFGANGRELGQAGNGRLPPQASVNGLGRFGAIGMMPPQAAAGVGSDMSPSGIPEGPMTAWRDGVFGGRRQPEPFGDQLYPPWRDGIFGPSLGQTGSPTLDFSGDAVMELKTSLNMLIASYALTPGTAYDAATEQAYVTFVEEQTPGYSDKTELYKLEGGRHYPSARGIYVLMNAARVAWAADVGQDASYERVASWYPKLWAFALAFESASYKGTVNIPAGAAADGGGGPIQASTVALLGVGAVGVGLIAIMLRPKRRR